MTLHEAILMQSYVERLRHPGLVIVACRAKKERHAQFLPSRHRQAHSRPLVMQVQKQRLRWQRGVKVEGRAADERSDPLQDPAVGPMGRKERMRPSSWSKGFAQLSTASSNSGMAGVRGMWHACSTLTSFGNFWK